MDRLTKRNEYGDAVLCDRLQGVGICLNEDVERVARYEDEREAQQWISIEDRLPEEPLQTVLVTNGKETCVGVYSIVYDEFGVMCGKGKAFGVTHWMPLPEPPKGEKP